MERLISLLESEHVESFLEGSEEIISEISSYVVEFKDVVKTFIREHKEEFIGETVEDLVKNIRVFTETSVAQFLTEMVSMYGNAMYEAFEQRIPVLETNGTIEDYV